eukprot:7054411-Pyramimonas_sp.AAC.1
MAAEGDAMAADDRCGYTQARGPHHEAAADRLAAEAGRHHRRGSDIRQRSRQGHSQAGSALGRTSRRREA